MKEVFGAVVTVQGASQQTPLCAHPSHLSLLFLFGWPFNKWGFSWLFLWVGKAVGLEELMGGAAWMENRRRLT